MGYCFGLCELDGTPIGRIHWPYERTWGPRLNGLPTVSFRIRIDDPLADEIFDRDGDCLVKVYDPSNTLCYIGDILTVEEGGPAQSGEGASITVTSAGPLWWLSKRLLGIPYPGVNPTWTDVQAHVIVRNILDQLNANSDTGIREGTFATLYKTDYGPAYLKPAKEALEELQAAKVPPPVETPASYTARDEFTGVDSDLHTSIATDTTAWDADLQLFFIWDAGNYAYRSATSDSSYSTGGWAKSGTGNHEAVLVGVDYQLSTPLAYSSGHDWYGGVFARYTDSNHWLWAYISLGDNTLRLRKKNGVGTDAEFEVFTFSPGGVVHSTRYAIRLLVDNDGNYAVWHYAPASGGPGEPTIYGRHADLASTGALATGKVGIADSFTTAGPADRSYYSFFAQDDPSPQSFDFEIAPVEPTADADGYPGTLPYIGELNISYQIGTSKPEVIFEYGSTAKSYKRNLSREGLCNIAYVLPTENWDPGITPAGALALSADLTSVGDRRAFEEVIPADFDNILLRQSLAVAHTRVRKIPRKLITFEPSDNAPEFLVDYIVGDFVGARAKVGGSVRFGDPPALWRVYGVDVSIDDEGRVTEVPTLVPA